MAMGGNNLFDMSLLYAMKERPVLAKDFVPGEPSNDVISIAAFFSDLLRDLSTAASSNSSLSAEIAFFGGGVLTVANDDAPDTDIPISHVFLDAVSHACPAIGLDDANRLVSCLLGQLHPHSEESLSSGSMDLSSSTQSTPSKGKEREIVEDEVSSMVSEGGVSARSSVDQSSASEGRGGRTKVAVINEESMDDLEKQGITFRMFVQVLDKAGKINAAHQEQVRMLATKQLKSLSAFLKLRRRDWGEQGPPLKARINVKLSCCLAETGVQKARINVKLSCCLAETGVQVNSILSLEESDGKASKEASRRTLAVLLEAVEACIVSLWRKLRICEELLAHFLRGSAKSQFIVGPAPPGAAYSLEATCSKHLCSG